MKIIRKVPIIMLLLSIACVPEDEIERISENIRVNNDVQQLNQRVRRMDDTLTILYKDSESGRKDDDLNLILKAEISPPSHNGKVLQATSVSNYKNDFLVTYNFRGEPYAGGIDLINDELGILSEFLTESDIYAVHTSGNDVYAVGARPSTVPAYLIRIKMQKEEFTEDFKTLELGSYAATSIFDDGSQLLVTTGDDALNGGGIYLVDEKDLVIDDFMPLHDARWITKYKKEWWIVQGTPGNVTVVNSNEKSLSETGSISFNGADVPESKSTISTYKDMIFIAGGQNGVFIVDAKSKEQIDQLEFPEDCITNAVSADKDLLFVSNGEGGVYVGRIDDKKMSSEIIGKIDFGENVSVNHIYYHNDKLWVASGLGGVKLIEVE